MYYCNACKQKRPAELIGWALSDLNTYCSLPSLCNESHPSNFGDKVLNNKTMIIREALDHHHLANKIEVWIKKLFNEPVSSRLDPHQVAYLLKYQDEHETLSANETIKAILNEHINDHSELSHKPLGNVTTNWIMSHNSMVRMNKRIKEEQDKWKNQDAYKKTKQEQKMEVMQKLKQNLEKEDHEAELAAIKTEVIELEQKKDELPEAKTWEV